MSVTEALTIYVALVDYWQLHYSQNCFVVRTMLEISQYSISLHSKGSVLSTHFMKRCENW